MNKNYEKFETYLSVYFILLQWKFITASSVVNKDDLIVEWEVGVTEFMSVVTFYNDMFILCSSKYDTSPKLNRFQAPV